MLRPVRAFPEVDAFVKAFEDDTLCRRPVVGGTNLGKSLLAAEVLKRVGAALGLGEFLEVTVEDDSFLDFTFLSFVNFRQATLAIMCCPPSRAAAR